LFIERNELQKEYNIKVKKAEFSVKVLKLNMFEYFYTLRKKLMWGLDIRN
jgi:NAD kinase